MRIFSIHKSKSKKQISEKTPKLAAQKFLEKRKVGTVIYLHEHPSGKIHGPYRKEYDKKIMKGGGFFGISSVPVSEFRIDRPRNSRTSYPPVLEGTDQLIIKIIHSGLFEPRIFFGDNNKKNDTEGSNYFTYVCKNKDSDINNLILFRKLEDSVNKAPPQIRELTLGEVKEIPPQILLGFYTQYIDRCKEGFYERGPVEFILMYMRRLFFYLFYHILPVIGEYIIRKYFSNIQQSNHLNTSIFQQIIQNIIQNNIEVKYFMNIINFLKRINFQEFIDEIKRICNLNQEQYQKLSQEISSILTNFNQLTPIQEINNIQQSIRQSRNSNSSSGNIVGNIVVSSAVAGVNPMEVVKFIGFVISIPFRIIFFFMQFAG